jgi:hypothetical protein
MEADWVIGASSTSYDGKRLLSYMNGNMIDCKAGQERRDVMLDQVSLGGLVGGTALKSGR